MLGAFHALVGLWCIGECEDRVDVDLHIARLDRDPRRQAAAIRPLRPAIPTYGTLSEAEAAKAWLNVLDPPPPPPATPPDNR